MAGEGNLAKLGIALEGTPGVGVTPTTTTPFTSESFEAPRDIVLNEGIGGSGVNKSASVGVENGTGSLTQNFDAESSGQLLRLWNGTSGYTAPAGAETDGIVAAAPTFAADAGGGTLDPGDYFYVVATVLNWTAPNQDVIMPSSPVSGAKTVAGTASPVLNWVNPSIPTEYTQAGTAIFRTEANGSAGTETFLAFVPGTATSFTDDGGTGSGQSNEFRDTSITYLDNSTQLYKHSMKALAPPSGQPRLPSVSVQISKNVGSDERFLGAQVDQFDLAVPEPGSNSPVTLNLSFLHLGVEEVAGEFAAAQPALKKPIISWQVAVVINETLTCQPQTMNITGANGLEPQYGLCNSPKATKLTTSQNRLISGSATYTFEDRDTWRKAVNAEEISLEVYLYGEPVLANGGTLSKVRHNVSAIPFPVSAKITLPRVAISSLVNPVDGPGQIIGSFDFTAFEDAGLATDMLIELTNTIATYF